MTYIKTDWTNDSGAAMNDENFDKIEQGIEDAHNGVGILQHGGTAAALAAANTVLLARQVAVETDTGKIKVGDGTTAYNSLPYSGLHQGYLGVKEVTGTEYTADLADIGWLIRCTAATAVTVTLPADIVAAIPTGCTIDFGQRGAGPLTFIAGAGVSPLIVADTAVTRKLGSTVTGTKEGPNLWSVVGDLA